MWDCIVVGGGAAGQAAALVLGRARRRVLLIDAGRQSNLAVHAVGGLLWQEGVSPADLYATGRRQLAAFPTVELREDEVTGGRAVGTGFELTLGDGTTAPTRRVLLAAGMDYIPPDLPGLAPLWGGAVFHCPFCHGWEVRDRALAVLAPGARLTHAALLLTMWSDDVVALTGGAAGPAADDRARLTAAGVRLDERAVAGLRAQGDRLTGIEFADGEVLARDGLMAATAMRARSGLAEAMGVSTTSSEYGPAGAISVDARQRTDVPGVFAAGDVTGALQQVSVAASSGATAGAMVVQSLLAEDHALPE